MRVELLYFEGCPAYEELAPRLRALLAGRAELELRRIDSWQDAQAQRLLGSPTVRVNGEDVDPEATGRSDYALTCRLYRTASGSSRVPPEDWLLRALDRGG